MFTMFYIIYFIFMLSEFYCTVNGKDEDNFRQIKLGQTNTSSRVSRSVHIKLLPSNCGLSKFESRRQKTRIIQGDVAELGQFPWMARLGRRRSDRTKWFFCAGVLISKYYVISAAHCHEKAHLVRLGENHLNTDIDCDINGHCAPPVQDIAVKTTRFYDFCPVTYLNDISLLELENAVEFNDFVKPICLPTAAVPDKDLLGKPAWISGWGKTSPNVYGDPDNLMYIKVPVLDRLPCNRIYEFTKTLLPSQLCLGYGEGKDSCHGDSGGPVTMQMPAHGTNRSHLIGIVSYGLPECGHGPAVYTNVGQFLVSIFKDLKKS